MKKTGLLMGLFILAGIFGTATVNAQTPSKETQAVAGYNLATEMQGVIESMKKFNEQGKVAGQMQSLQELSASVDSKTGLLHFQNLSTAGTQGKAGVVQKLAASEKVEKLSSKEVVAKLSSIVSSLEAMHDAELNSVLTNLKTLKTKYEGSSYQSMKDAVKQ